MPRVAPAKLIERGSEDLKRAVADMETGFNVFIVDNKQDDFSYIWAAKDPTHPQSVDKQQRLGYEVVNNINGGDEVAPFADVQTTENGSIQTREHVLMRIPIELAGYRNKRASELGHERIKSMKDDLQDRVERSGSRVLNNEGAI